MAQHNAPEEQPFGPQLLREAETVFADLERRGLSQKLRTARAGNHIGRLVTKYVGEMIYVNATDVQVPDVDGIGVGLTETTGEIVGFSYGQYYTGRGNQQKGLMMYMGVGGMNKTEAKDASWRLNVLAAQGVRLPEEPGKERFILAIPLKQGQRITQLEKETLIPDTIANLDKEVEAPKDFEYMEYVKHMDAITGGYPLTTAVMDKAKAIACNNELTAMVKNCPYLGNKVEINASLARVRHPDDTDRMMLIRGNLTGILRKFINDAYQIDGTWRYGVQAVIYSPEIAEMVYAGTLTPQQADETAIYVPLSTTHELHVLEP